MANTIIYTLHGDYLLPDLKLPEQPKVEIGVFGQRHKRYLKEHHRLTSCDQCHIMIEQRRKTDKLSGFYITQQTEICCMSVGICNDRIEKNHPYKIGFCLRTKLLKLCKNIFVSLPDSI